MNLNKPIDDMLLDILLDDIPLDKPFEIPLDDIPYPLIICPLIYSMMIYP